MFECVVKKLSDLGKTISTMESCTGGAIANEITNIEGASEVLKYSAITYSNEFKIKMGVSKDIIDEFTVYSAEVAREMSKKISDFTLSDYGIGVTGRINRSDSSNLVGGDNSTIYVSVYDRENDKYYESIVKAVNESRCENKELVVKNIVEMMEKDIL